MKCNKCGYDNPNDSNYCINCGEKLEKSKKSMTVIDLGSGWGTLLLPLARNFPQHKFIGYEISKLPFIVSTWRGRNYQNLMFYKKDIIYDGPPTANGKPHIGHVLTRVIKDMIPRYRTMKGYTVPRKAGWDTHGLPVELEVEKLLGLDGKEQIEEYGLAPFIDKCKESVWKYKGMWEDFSGTVGFWADMDDPYVTYHDDFIESEWWALKTIWDKGLLYKGFKIVPYCPRCGTPLSSQRAPDPPAHGHAAGHGSDGSRRRHYPRGQASGSAALLRGCGRGAGFP